MPRLGSAYGEAGWAGLTAPDAAGGQELPMALAAAAQELCDAADPAFGMLAINARSATRLLERHGDEETRAAWLPRLAGGAWTATICISEPQAGSDVGRIRTRAEQDGGGTWRLTGEKCWISYGDCDPARIVFHPHYVRWMDEGFHEMARARGVDSAALQAADPGFRGTPLVNISCAFRAPALYGDTLEHRIAPPEFGGGRSFRVGHTFRKAGAVVAGGEQVRIWGVDAPGGGGPRAVPVPADATARLRGDAP